MLQTCSFTGNQRVGDALRLYADARIERAGILRKFPRQLAQTRCPLFGVELQWRRLREGNLRVLGGKIVGAIGGGGAQLFVGPNLDQPLRRVAVDAVGGEPNRLPDRSRIVFECDLCRRREARDLSIDAPVVVKLRSAYAYSDVEQPRVILILGRDGAVGRANLN